MNRRIPHWEMPLRNINVYTQRNWQQTGKHYRQFVNMQHWSFAAWYQFRRVTKTSLVRTMSLTTAERWRQQQTLSLTPQYSDHHPLVLSTYNIYLIIVLCVLRRNSLSCNWIEKTKTKLHKQLRRYVTTVQGKVSWQKVASPSCWPRGCVCIRPILTKS